MSGAKDVTIDVLNAARVYELVRDDLAVVAPTVAVVFGWREPTKQINQGAGGANRITFVPGDETGKAGEYRGAKGKAHPARIYEKIELVTVRIWAVDASNPTDDSLQYQAVSALEDVALNALHRVFGGRFQLDAPEWVIAPMERVFGREKTFQIWLQVPVVKTPIAAISAQPAEAPIVGTALVTPTGDEAVD